MPDLLADPATRLAMGQLRQARLVATVPRLRVLVVLQNHPSHVLTLHDVHMALLQLGHSVSLVSTYQTLHRLSLAGLLDRVPCGPRRQGGKVPHVFRLRQRCHGAPIAG